MITNIIVWDDLINGSDEINKFLALKWLEQIKKENKPEPKFIIIIDYYDENRKEFEEWLKEQQIEMTKYENQSKYTNAYIINDNNSMIRIKLAWGGN